MSEAPSPTVVIDPAAETDPRALITLLNAAFAGYVGGDLHLDPAALHHLIYRQQIDLSLSRVAASDGRLLAFAGVSRRGWTSHLAIMGVHPVAAGRGIATRLTVALLEEASRRGDRMFELEVIEQNPAAVRVYHKAGFRTHGRLIELKRPGAAPAYPEDDALEEIDVAEAAARLVHHADADTPWPLSGYNLATLGPQGRAWHLDRAWALATVPADPQADASLLALVVAAEARGQGRGRRLLAAILARHPERNWHVPANCPERHGAFLTGAGFEQGPLSQLHMRCRLG